MTRLLLVRHGQSLANLQMCFAGQINPPLTELGHAQAECTATFLLENYHIDRIYSSDLLRAYHTGLHAAEKLGLPIQQDVALREIFAGEWEGRAFDELSAENSQAYKEWRQDIGYARCPGGETVVELTRRFADALTRIAEENPGKTVLITTHATPIRTFQWYTSGQDQSYMQQIPWVSNASVSEFSYENGVFVPVKISQDAHLASMKTELPSNI